MSLTRPVSFITHEAAAKAVAAALEAARARHVAVVAAVVDGGGHLVALARGDGAFIASIDIARDKAYTAAVFGAPTDGLAEALRHSQVLLDGIASRPHVVLFGGGLPVRHEGLVIGGIGVSGGSEEDDRVCATAGLRAIGIGP
ncbi:heme-binding protein [Acidocella sp.]|uniref:GlcG/HbpS family heme-binding protein n=1 Tax=Acidocella sp. TaxID=50710 RepID=UPI00262481B3|nr:heme-binding protein [Acidocella sp.]